MNSSRTYCRLGVLAAIMVAMTSGMTSACDPGLEVFLTGQIDPEWVHVGCHRSVDAYATGGTVYNWRYYTWPGGTCSMCDWIAWGWTPCGDPPPSSCNNFTSVGTYNMVVEVEEVDPYTWQVTDYAYDDRTVYAVSVNLSTDRTLLSTGGPRARVELSVQPAGPTGDCQVMLSLGGTAPFANVYDASTGGNVLLYGGTSRCWPVSSCPSVVWVQGVSASDDCWLAIHYVDPYGVPHPSGCESPHVDFGIYECVPLHGYCDYDSQCCSNRCNPITHECAECGLHSDCEECEQCTGDTVFPGFCISILPCPTYTHCDDHYCVADCVENGPACSYTPPTPAGNCSVFDPVDKQCPQEWDQCRICDYKVTETYILWTATCVIPDCERISSPCVKLRAVFCDDEWIPALGKNCHCCNHEGYGCYGTPFDSGSGLECPEI